MRTLTLLTVAVAVTLTACATHQNAYYEAISSREKRLAEQETRADLAIADMAAKGDAQSKGMGIMYFALKSSSAKQNQQAIAAPKTTAEQMLPWASLIIPSLTQLYTIQQGTTVQLRQSDNALAGKIDDNDLITDLVKGRIDPIVGDSDDVLIYPR
jgi:hypothetical protein